LNRPLVEVRQDLATADHLVTGIRVQQPARRRLKAEPTGDEGDDHDTEDDTRADISERLGQDPVDRVGVLTADHSREVGDRQDQRERDEDGRGATDVDRHTHRLGDDATRILDLLGDVAARLEAVVLVDADQAGGEECRDVRAVPLRALRLEQHAQAVVTI
jgi:hypothetical protein